MSATNPLQKYFRQPKIFIDLPSKGLYYGDGRSGSSTNIPVYGMTGMDEIIMKTPDALFSGESTVKVVQSCCPNIVNAWKMPSIDVDCLLVAIRIASYGANMDVVHRCPNCQSINDYTVNLSDILGYLSSQVYDNKIDCGEIKIVIRPLAYEEITKFNIENYKLQKMLNQLSKLESSGEDDAAIKAQHDVYQRISDMQLELFEISIEHIETPDGNVYDKEFISEWIRNSDKDFFTNIKSKLERNKQQWDIPNQNVECPECQHHSKVVITMDQSSFFAKS
jgi:regulator of replication initiation timing